jgi:hypothetical protein
MTSVSIIFSTGEKKWTPMNCSGRFEFSARPVIGRVEVLEAKIAVSGMHGLHLLDDGLLDGAVLEDGLDHEVDVGERRIVRRRGDQGQQLFAVFLRHAALADLVGDQLLGMRLALVGGFLVAVDEDHGNAGGGGDIGDRGAHEARADDADLPELRFRHAGRAAGALAQFLHGDEERADHREGLGGLQDLREIALLDP